MHILPRNFFKVRHYGILSGSWKNRMFPDIEKVKSEWASYWLEKGLDIYKCPSCKTGILQLIEILLPKRGPP